LPVNNRFQPGQGKRPDDPFEESWFALASGGLLAADNWTLDTFCSEVQRVTAQTNVKANLTIHQTSQDYRASKPGIEPVEIPQSVTPDATGRPKMISCKVKSVDHLKSAYGPGAAGAQGTCEQVTRSVVEQARARAGAAAHGCPCRSGSAGLDGQQLPGALRAA